MRATTSVSIAVLFALLLGGCRVELQSEASLSQLQAGSVQEIPGRMRVEVIACDDYEDSRNSSQSLINAQQIVTQIFPRAEFIECYSERFDDWAVFSLPLSIDRDGDPATFPAQDTISLRSTIQSPLAVAIPRPVVQRSEAAESERIVIPRFSSIDITIELRNDTGEAFEAWVLASWVDGTPTGAGIVRIPNGQSVELSLSDVLISEAWGVGEGTVLERGCNAAAGEDCQNSLSAQRRGVPLR